jgi:hypothetical protein
VYIPMHEQTGAFDDLSDEQLEAIVARIYSDDVNDNAFEQSGTSPTNNGEPNAL